MKKGWGLFVAGAAIGAVAGLIAYKKYQDSYDEVIDEEDTVAEITEEDDFVPAEVVDDDFDYVIEVDIEEE